MQRKKTQSILVAGLLAVVLLISLIPMAFAEENLISPASGLDSETVSDINTGIDGTDGAGKMLGQRLGLLFTFDKEKKAEKELKLARLELIRARIAVEHNDTKALEKALENHERWMQRVEARVNITSDDPTREGINKSLNNLVGLERAIDVHEFHIARLNLLINESNLTEEQIAQVQEKINQIEDSIAHLNDVQDSKKDRLKTKLMAVSNMTDDEAEDEIEDIENFHSLAEVQKYVVEKRMEQIEEQIAHLQEKIAEAKAKGRNTTNAEARLAEMQAGLAQATIFYNAGNYSEAKTQLNMGEGIEKQNREGERRGNGSGLMNGSGIQNQIKAQEKETGLEHECFQNESGNRSCLGNGSGLKDGSGLGKGRSD